MVIFLKPAFSIRVYENYEIMGLTWVYHMIPSGNDSQFATLKMAIEIVEFPISMVMFHS